MGKYKRLELLAIGLIIIVQGIHSGTAAISMGLGEEADHLEKPNEFNYHRNHQFVQDKLVIAFCIVDVVLLIILLLHKLFGPDGNWRSNMAYKIILISIQVALIMDSCHRFYSRNDTLQSDISSQKYQQLKQRLSILVRVQFGLSLFFDVGGTIKLIFQLFFQKCGKENNINEVVPSNAEEIQIQID